MKNLIPIIAISDFDRDHCLLTFCPPEGSPAAQGKLSKSDLKNLNQAVKNRIKRMNSKQYHEIYE